MDFLTEYESKVLKTLEENKKTLEKRIDKKGLFATKAEKERLEKISNLYYEKLEWYTRMLDLEFDL